MTRIEAVNAVIAMAGGLPCAAVNTVYRFGSLRAADRCKAILDALLPPGTTGAVFADGRLIVDMLMVTGDEVASSGS